VIVKIATELPLFRELSCAALSDQNGALPVAQAGSAAQVIGARMPRSAKPQPPMSSSSMRLR
jgi:hypothetical protein